MKLLIVRHGIAMARDDYQALPGPDMRSRNDEQRPLTDFGIRKMHKNAKGLRQLLRDPEILLTSPLKRTVETCEILQKVWPEAKRFDLDELTPGTRPEKLIDWFRHNEEYSDKTVVLVGHETQLSVLIGWFITGARGFSELKKGGACLIEFESGPRKQQGRLRWWVSPKILSSLR